jgi:hypothetical protein
MKYLRNLAFVLSAVLGMLVAMVATANAQTTVQAQGLFRGQSTSLELVGGSVNYQLQNDGTSAYNVNKWSSDGRLSFQDSLGLRLVAEDRFVYNAVEFYGGNNTIGQPMGGLIESSGFKINWTGPKWAKGTTTYVGWAIGGYLQNDNSYRGTTGQTPTELTAFGGEGLVPILGLELDYKVPISRAMYLKLNNTIQPTNINTSLAFGVSF